MFSRISWSTFISYTALTIAAYYLIIFLLFYRKRFKTVFTGYGKTGLKTAIPEKQVTIPQSGQQVVESREDQYMPGIDQLEKIINELRYEVIPKAGKSPTKAKLAILFQNYMATLNGNLPVTFKNSIVRLMIKEATEQCGVSFQEEELHQLW